MKEKNSSRKKITNIALLGIFSAVALTISFFEHTLTAALPLPPGIKPGLSNVVTMFVCFTMGLPFALITAAIKSGFMFFISGATGGFISLTGGLLSVTVMWLTKKIFREKLSYLGISVISAVFHNLGQLAASSLIVGSALYLSYAPVLILSGVVFGSVTGIILNNAMPAIIRTVKNTFYK